MIQTIRFSVAWACLILCLSGIQPAHAGERSTTSVVGSTARGYDLAATQAPSNDRGAQARVSVGIGLNFDESLERVFAVLGHNYEQLLQRVSVGIGLNCEDDAERVSVGIGLNRARAGAVTPR